MLTRVLDNWLIEKQEAFNQWLSASLQNTMNAFLEILAICLWLGVVCGGIWFIISEGKSTKASGLMKICIAIYMFLGLAEII